MKNKFFTKEQIKKIYWFIDQFPDDPTLLLIEILAITGCRTNELMRMLLSDHDPKEHTLTIQRGSKMSESRTCPIGFRLSAKLTRIADDHKLGPHDPICYVVSKGNIDTAARTMRLAFDVMKTKLFIGQKLPCLHGFRHSKAKHVYESTRDIYVVKHVLGHVKMASTELYLPNFNMQQYAPLLASRDVDKPIAKKRRRA